MRAGTEEVAELIVAAAEPGGRSRALEAPHGAVSAFDAPVVLLQSIVQVAAGPVPHRSAQLGPDRPGVAVVAVRRHPVRRHPGDRLGGAEERLRRRHVAVLAEHHVHQRAGAVDGTIEIAPAALDLDVGLVDVPAPACLTAPAPPQVLGQGRGELRFPLAHRLMAEHEAADEEHLGQVTQGELVAQAPEHHERDDVARVLGPVQPAAGALVELLGAGATAEAAIALGRALGPLRHRLRPTLYAPHPIRPAVRAGHIPRPLLISQGGVARDLTEPTRLMPLSVPTMKVSAESSW